MRVSQKGKLWMSRAFYLADLLAGVARGIHCPSCGTAEALSLVSPGRRFNYFFECRGCHLFFRPTGLQHGRIPELYYSRFYEAGLATSGDAVLSPALRERMVGAEGKNRNDLVRLLFGPPEAGEIAVFGCSWGYEVSDLLKAGYTAFGIELSSRRRGWGRDRLGLTIYESPATAAADGRTPALVLSSHVLEHVPKLEPTLDDLQATLRPRRHIHITPYVDDFRSNSERGTIIGREHPLGVTTAFWRRWSGKLGFALESRQGGDLGGTAPWELVAAIDASART
jgi:hypothetical protein